MRLREMTSKGLRIWPPQWSSSSHPIDEKAVLRNVKIIVGTSLMRIDIDHNGITHLGIMSVEKGVSESLYQRLKENVGKPLSVIADLEIAID